MSTTFPYNQAGVVYGPGWYPSGGQWLAQEFQPELNLRVTVSGGASPEFTLAYQCSGASSVGITVNGTASTITTDSSNTPQQMTILSTAANGVYNIKVKRMDQTGTMLIPLTNTFTLSAGTGVIASAPGYGAYKSFADVTQTNGVAGGTYFLFTRAQPWTSVTNFLSGVSGYTQGLDAVSGFYGQDNCVRFNGAFTNITPYVFTPAANPTGIAVTVDDALAETFIKNRVVAGTDGYDAVPFNGFSGTHRYELNFSGLGSQMFGFFYDGALDTSATIAKPGHDVVGYMDSITDGYVEKQLSATSHGYLVSLNLRRGGTDVRYYNISHPGMTVGTLGTIGSSNSLMTPENINKFNLTTDPTPGLLERAPLLVLNMPSGANDHFDGFEPSFAPNIRAQMGLFISTILTQYSSAKMVVGDMLIGGNYTNGTNDNLIRGAVLSGVQDELPSYPGRLSFAEMTLTPLGLDKYWADGTAGGPNGGGTGVHPSTLGVQQYISTIQASVSTIIPPPSAILVASLVNQGLRSKIIGGPQYDANAAAFISAAGIISVTEKNAINAFVLALKANGIWSKMVALYPFVGGYAIPHSFNLINPANYQIVWGMPGGIIHSANGITGDGSTGFGDTGLFPEAIGAVGGFSAYINVMSTVTNGDVIGTSISDGSQKYMLRMDTPESLQFAFYGQNNFADVVGVATPGFFLGNRDSSTSLRLDKNGSTIATNATSTTPAATGGSYYLLANNIVGTGTQNYSDATVATICFNQSLTTGDSANLYTAVQAFETALGRQV